MDGQKIKLQGRNVEKVRVKYFLKYGQPWLAVVSATRPKDLYFDEKFLLVFVFPPAPFYASDGPMHSTPMGKDVKDFARKKACILQN